MIFPPIPDAYHQRASYLYHPPHGDNPKLFLCRMKEVATQMLFVLLLSA